MESRSSLWLGGSGVAGSCGAGPWSLLRDSPCCPPQHWDLAPQAPHDEQQHRLAAPPGGQQGRGLQPGPVPYPAGEQARLGTALDIRQLPGNSLPQSSFVLGAVCAVSQRYESVSPLPCLLPDVVCILIA